VRRLQALPGRVQRSARARFRRRLRGLLVRYARAEPSAEERAGAERRVVILLGNAWGMGGTIRTTLNLAEYLAESYEVEIVSIGRWRDKPFFERFPPGVRVVTLEDKRKRVLAGKLPFLQRRLRAIPSVLMDPSDKTYATGWNLWIDIKLVHRLRGRAGYLMTTRPGLNLIAADLDLPGFVTIGQEHMHFYNHVKPLRKSIRQKYERLDTLTVLTERDKTTYEDRLHAPTRIVRIPNAVRDMGAGRADLDAPVMLAAGRMSPQKGFDMLVQAWAQVAPRHPDWRLRICGDGKLRKKVERLIEENDLAGSVSLEPAARDLGGEMDKCSVFVMSSRFEGFPLILLEAMSKGMAVASFDCPTGPADIVDDHRNGLLVPPKDVDGLAAAIGELASNDGLRRRCGEAAVETAGQYSMAAIGAQWDDLLRDLAPKLRA
jgi:glycosyltransferase involved in cell wall biosynthesis